MTDKEKVDKYKESYDLLLVDFNKQHETIKKMEATIKEQRLELEVINLKISCDCIKIFDVIKSYIRLKGA